MESVTRKAYGKVNIVLDVTGRRDDGYHLVRMVMQTVGIFDVITVKRRSLQSRTGDISISSNLKEVPEGPGNIAWRAARLIMDSYGIEDDIFIHIEKNIPMAAGMAGGSTDGAAVIHCMNELYGLKMSAEEMDSVALRLGADVPFCLRTGTWLSEGIGEVLTPAGSAPEADVLIVNPPFGVSTAEVYGAFDLLADPAHPDVDAVLCSIREGSLADMAASMENILEPVTRGKYPLIAEIEANMMRLGALNSIMTGSGPTVFGLFEDRKSACKALEFFKSKEEYGRSFLTEFIK